MMNIILFNFQCSAKDKEVYFNILEQFKVNFPLSAIRDISVNGLDEFFPDEPDFDDFFCEMELQQVMQLPVIQLKLDDVAFSLKPGGDVRMKLFCFECNRGDTSGYFVFTNGKWGFIR